MGLVRLVTACFLTAAAGTAAAVPGGPKPWLEPAYSTPDGVVVVPGTFEGPPPEILGGPVGARPDGPAPEPEAPGVLWSGHMVSLEGLRTTREGRPVALPASRGMPGAPPLGQQGVSVSMPRAAGRPSVPVVAAPVRDLPAGPPSRPASPAPPPVGSVPASSRGSSGVVSFTRRDPPAVAAAAELLKSGPVASADDGIVRMPSSATGGKLKGSSTGSKVRNFRGTVTRASSRVTAPQVAVLQAPSVTAQTPVVSAPVMPPAKPSGSAKPTAVKASPVKSATVVKRVS